MKFFIYYAIIFALIIIKDNTVILKYLLRKPKQLTPIKSLPDYQKRFISQDDILLQQAFKRLNLKQNTESTLINKKNTTNLNAECTDPSEYDLEDMLLRFDEISFRAFFFGEASSSGHTLNNNKYHKSVLNSQCNNKNIFSLEEQSVCPYELIKIQKDGRFPKYLESARCLCNYCNLDKSNSLMYECEPVYKKVKVLVRHKCGNDGVYEWKGDVELVARICSCSSRRMINFF